jgi:hypothetical protein
MLQIQGCHSIPACGLRPAACPVNQRLAEDHTREVATQVVETGCDFSRIDEGI